VLRITVVAGIPGQKTPAPMGVKKDKMILGQTRLLQIKIKNKKLILGQARCLLVWVLMTTILAGTMLQRTLHLS